jgi:hypothetical protein
MSTTESETKLKIGVVIQGPILSIGVTGENSDIVEYDSSQTVVEQYKASQSLDCEVVVVTWDREDTSKLIGIRETDILKLEDYKHSFRNNFKNQSFSGKNKFRQFHSTLKGVEELGDRGCNFILKIRTDQLLDLNSLILFIKTFPNILAETAIFVPFLNPLMANYIDDFYFCGTQKSMIIFSENFLSSKELHQNVHRDIFYKWAKLRKNNRNLLLYFPQIYPRIGSLTKKQLFLILSIWKNDFKVLPQAVYGSIVWRGYKFGKSEESKMKNLVFSDSTALNWELQIIQGMNRVNNCFKIDLLSMMTYFFTSRGENLARRILDKCRKHLRQLLIWLIGKINKT